MQRSALNLGGLLSLALFMVSPSAGFAYQILPYVSKEEPHSPHRFAPTHPAGLEPMPIGVPYIIGNKLRIMGAISGVTREDPPNRSDRCSVYLDPLQERPDVYRRNVITIRANMGVMDFPIFWVIPRDIQTGWYRVVITLRGQEFRSSNFEIRRMSSPSEGYTSPRGVDLSGAIRDIRLTRRGSNDYIKFKVDGGILGGPVRRLNNVEVRWWVKYFSPDNELLLQRQGQFFFDTVPGSRQISVWSPKGAFGEYLRLPTKGGAYCSVAVSIDPDDRFGDPNPRNNRVSERAYFR
jgi:hypothetical protein